MLAHEPPVVFKDAAAAFVEPVREASDGDIAVQLFGADDPIGTGLLEGLLPQGQRVSRRAP